MNEHGRLPESGIQSAIEDGIRAFPFDDFGMDDVAFALEDDPAAQEWVPALARQIIEAIADRAAGITGQAGEVPR